MRLTKKLNVNENTIEIKIVFVDKIEGTREYFVKQNPIDGPKAKSEGVYKNPMLTQIMHFCIK